jgi:hypothetical protein
VDDLLQEGVPTVDDPKEVTRFVKRTMDTVDRLAGLMIQAGVVPFKSDR